MATAAVATMATTSEPNTTEPEVVGDFEFTENSKAMYDTVLSRPPFFVRFLVRNKLNAALKAKGCGKVTEQIMYDVIRETTPKSWVDESIEILNSLRTNPEAK